LVLNFNTEEDEEEAIFMISTARILVTPFSGQASPEAPLVCQRILASLLSEPQIMRMSHSSSLNLLSNVIYARIELPENWGINCFPGVL